LTLFKGAVFWRPETKQSSGTASIGTQGSKPKHKGKFMSQSDSNCTLADTRSATSNQRPSTFRELCRWRMSILQEWQAQNDISVREFAILLCVTPSTLRRWFKNTPRINGEAKWKGFVTFMRAHPVVRRRLKEEMV
jgi:hypothetical protein